jgi:GntR family histidine utilization transcriptional repressor
MKYSKQSKLKSAPQPLYQMVKNHILNLIQSGRIRPEERIPSENELVSTLKVSRMTVNRALRELAAEGLLVRIQGVGTFAARPKPQSALLEIVSIAEEIRRQGGIHSSKVHLLRSERASPKTAKKMAFYPGEEVFHAVIVHFDRGLPIQLADRYVNPLVAPQFLEQDFSTMTPGEYLMEVSLITEVEHLIEAALADKNARAVLKLKRNTPCLLLHRTTWAGDIVAAHNRFVYPGTRFRLGGRFKPSIAPQYMHQQR